MSAEAVDRERHYYRRDYSEVSADLHLKVKGWVIMSDRVNRGMVQRVDVDTLDDLEAAFIGYDQNVSENGPTLRQYFLYDPRRWQDVLVLHGNDKEFSRNYVDALNRGLLTIQTASAYRLTILGREVYQRPVPHLSS